ncbi:ASCH domain-containing protein [Pectobacterium aroidearum]|uniref:hypothetical protein n=1 Tax=Pectobacterium aroidearum TaxID=1201031 RepID=UPI001CD515C9|nr:hypothetical protein [Pectobacterium aroidearum]
MKERPIIFNAEMVRAILDGRKTQTRRVVRHQPDEDGLARLSGGPWMDTSEKVYRCPYGEVGDRLWVREAFRVHSRATDVATLVYRASERNSWTEQTRRVPVSACGKPVSPEKWTPSIHMPRWASRITLEITAVRVERLASISNADAAKEGYPANPEPYGGQMDQWLWFRQLWDGIYPDKSFKVNPWVWVIEFKRVEV